MKKFSIVAYISSIILANLLVIYIGIIDIGIISFPAGAIMIGLCFSLRDFVQKYYGKYKCWLWMLLATIITILFSREVAFASGIAFLLAESIDWLVFTFYNNSFKKRLILSNILSLPVDSLVFVPILFGWNWELIIGQAIIKIVSSFIILPFIKEKS